MPGLSAVSGISRITAGCDNRGWAEVPVQCVGRDKLRTKDGFQTRRVLQRASLAGRWVLWHRDEQEPVA